MGRNAYVIYGQLIGFGRIGSSSFTSLFGGSQLRVLGLTILGSTIQFLFLGHRALLRGSRTFKDGVI